MFRERNCRKSIGALTRIIIAAIIISLLSLSSAFAAEEFINQARSVIKNFYIEEVSGDVLNKPTIKEIVEALNDPYSQYLTKEEYLELTDAINREITGIGVQIDIIPEGVRILSVIDNSPAEEAGLIEGDIITMADGRKLSGMSLDEASSYIKGKEGTVVKLQVKRREEYISFDVTRRHVTFPTVEGRMIDGRAAYIRITSFGETTSSDFRVKLAEMEKYLPKSYIIDIRNNGGGYLDTAIDMAGSFLGKRKAVLTRDRSNHENVYFAPGNVDVIDKPVILLVNQYSASASEILAAALKDYNAAFIIGNRTYGKGTVQSLFQLFDDSVLKLTSYKFFSPYGNPINKVGVEPDFETGNIDALAVAELLSGYSGIKQDKTGYLKIRLKGREFEVDLVKARTPEYWQAFSHIISKAAFSGQEISLGTDSGWTRINDYTPDRIYEIYYPYYRETAGLEDVPVDKQFTVKFSMEINKNTINKNSIELIDALSGERVEMDFIFLDHMTLKAVPKESLKPGGTYYFIINNSVRGAGGNRIKEGTVTRVTVGQ